MFDAEDIHRLFYCLKVTQVINIPAFFSLFIADGIGMCELFRSQ